MNLLLLFVAFYIISLCSSNNFGFRNAVLKRYRKFRVFLYNNVRTSVNSQRNQEILLEKNKLPPYLDPDTPFPCPLNDTRSTKRPTSVHLLRPGDIDVVGAFGDSLTVGVGLTATKLYQVYFENRGLSPTAGGMGTWREFLTIPNILKEFNSNLIGYATQPAINIQLESVFNVASTGATSADISHMAMLLIRRIRSHPRVDFQNDWKLITFMIGPNDFCLNICRRSEEQFLENHRNDLIETLRILRDNLPRTLISLVLAPNLRTLIEFVNRPQKCHINHLFVCPCLIGEKVKKKQPKFIEIMKKWQDVESEVASLDEFDTDTFTVVVQPFAKNLKIPDTEEGITDYSYFSEDCFHFSQKGNTMIVNSIWNNMLEPVGQKTTRETRIFERFICPSAIRPYIATRRNRFII